MEDHISTNPTEVDAPTQSSQPSIEPTASNAPEPKALLTPEEIARVKDMLQSNKRLSMGKWTAPRIIAFVTTIGVLATLYTTFNTNIVTLLYEETIKKYHVLESQLRTIEVEKNDLEKERQQLVVEIRSSKDDLANLLNDIEDQKTVVNKLQLDRKKLESNLKESLLKAFADNVYGYLLELQESPEITVDIEFYVYHAEKAQTLTLKMPYSMRLEFDDILWGVIIDHVKKRFDGIFPEKEGERKIKREIKLSEPTDLKVIIGYSIERISRWSTLSKEFGQDLSEKVDRYIKNYPEEFKIPLDFRFTGMTMTVNEANAELQRLRATFHTLTNAEDHEFESKHHAAVFKLLRFLGYNKP